LPKFEEKDFDESKKHLIRPLREIMELRNKFVAHRGKNVNEFSFAYLQLKIDGNQRGLRVKTLQRNRPPKSDLPIQIELLDYLIELTESKFRKEADKVWNHILKSFTPEQINILLIARPATPYIKNSAINKDSK